MNYKNCDIHECLDKKGEYSCGNDIWSSIRELSIDCYLDLPDRFRFRVEAEASVEEQGRHIIRHGYVEYMNYAYSVDQVGKYGAEVNDCDHDWESVVNNLKPLTLEQYVNYGRGE